MMFLLTLISKVPELKLDYIIFRIKGIVFDYIPFFMALSIPYPSRAAKMPPGIHGNGI
jgi:hypothetical protein